MMLDSYPFVIGKGKKDMLDVRNVVKMVVDIRQEKIGNESQLIEVKDKNKPSEVENGKEMVGKEVIEVNKEKEEGEIIECPQEPKPTHTL